MSETLAITHLPTEALLPNGWNPNRQSDEVARAEAESIERYGFIDPVTVRPHPERPDAWEIVDGEHRWRHATERGMATTPSVILDLTDEEARKLTIVLNETRGEADIGALGTLLAELKESQPLEEFLAGLPWSSGELDRLLAIAAIDWDDFAPTAVEPPTGTPEVDQSSWQTIPFDSDQAEQYALHLSMLMREWDTDEPAAILRALSAAAQAL